MADYVIRVWRLSRLSTDTASLSLPTVSIIGRVMELGVPDTHAKQKRSRKPLPDPDYTDADIVQGIVEKMPREMRSSFEAYHLGIIRAESCKELPHAARALTLGIDKSTYYRRLEAGKRFVMEWWSDVLDCCDNFSENRIA